MNKQEYENYLKTLHWKKIRDIMFSMDSEPACELCLKQDSQIDIHHIHYNSIGDESYDDLVMLCHDCHEKVHREKLTFIRDKGTHIHAYRSALFILHVYSGFTIEESKMIANANTSRKTEDFKKLSDVIDTWFTTFQSAEKNTIILR